MKTIAVLLTVFNRKDKTINCLRALFNQTLPSGYDLIVYLTNDGCTDGTPEAVKNLFPNVHIINGDGNLFWNRGMIAAWNEALKSNPDFYLWLNDDTELLEGAIINLIDSFNDKKESIIIGTCRASTNDNKITYGARDNAFKLIHPQKANAKIVTFNGNIVLIPNSVYEILGMLDQTYHHSLGDFDYGLRATKLGIPIIVAKEIVGVCDTHPFMPKWCNPEVTLNKRWENFWSPNGANPIEFFKFRKKHYGILPACLTFGSNIIHVLFPQLWRN